MLSNARIYLKVYLPELEPKNPLTEVRTIDIFYISVKTTDLSSLCVKLSAGDILTCVFMLPGRHNEPDPENVT